MGIPTDPNEWSYGASCFCWASGFTPDTLYASVSGIMVGASWNPGMVPPPNGIHVLTQKISPCFWSDAPPPHASFYETTTISSGLHIVASMMVTGFSGWADAGCVFHFVNQLVDPGGFYYGGQAVICQRESGSSAPSLADIAELLNMQGRESRKSEFFPLDNDELVAMFADQVESTRVRIKYQFPTGGISWH